METIPDCSVVCVCVLWHLCVLEREPPIASAADEQLC